MGQDATAGSIFHVWGARGAPSIGQISSETGLGEDWAVITDMDGYAITSLKAGTHYLCYIVCEDLEEIQVALIQFNTFYFANVTTGEGSLPTPIAKPNPDPDPDPDPEPQAPIVSGEATSTALSEYAGDVAELGFDDGTTVYELVSTSLWDDRVKIAADNNKKYLDVDFVVTANNWWFTVWVCNANGMLDGSYFVGEQSTSTNTAHATFGDGFAKYSGTNAGKTRIQVLENGAVKTGGRTNGTIYTLRVWLDEEDVTEIQIGNDNGTMLFANIQSTDEEPVVTVVLKRYDDSVLSQYDGDVTALGFEEGERVQYMVTETTENAWGTEPTSGKTREQLAPHIPGEAGKYVTIKFATNTDIPSGSVFYVWGLLGSTYTQDGGVNFTTTDKGIILDVNGYPVTSISKNTVYVLQFYIANTDTYKLSNIVSTGMELYFAPDSIECLDKPFAVEFPSASDLVQSAGSNKSAVTVYNGDVASLGFANGSKVFKYVGATTNDKVGIKVDNTYDYFDVQLVWDANSSKTWILGFGLSGPGAFLNGADAYIVSSEGVRFNANASNPLDRQFKFFDAQGNEINTAMEKGKLYTMRVYTTGNLVEFQMRTTGVTLYLANVTYGNDPVVPKGVEIKVGDEKADPTVFTGNETSYGFEEGTEVVQLDVVSAIADENKIVMDVDSNEECLVIDFALEYELYANIHIWTVTGGEKVKVAEISFEGGLVSGDGVVVIKDANGDDVTADMLSCMAKYTLFIYFDGANEVHIGCDDYADEVGNILYFADARYEA